MTSEPSSQSASAPGDIFATTRWTVVLAARLLQITGFTENPRGVKIRYKLVSK